MAKRYQVLFVLSLLSMITFLDRIALSSASVSIMGDLHINTMQWGWILGMFTLAYGIFEMPTGWLGDKIGGKKVLFRVVIWWSLFTVLTGFSSGFLMLLIVRFLFGIGEAGAYPNTSIVLSKWFPVLERGRAQATIWGASRIGAALTPFLVIPLQHRYGWHMPFYLLGIVGIIWAIFWFKWHKEDPSECKNIEARELAYIQAERGLPVEQEASKAFHWSIFKSKNLWLLMAMYLCYAIGAYFFQSWFHTYLEKGRLIAKDQLIWASSLPYLLAAIGCFTGGWLSDKACLKFGKKWGRRIVPLVGLFVSGICIIAASLTSDNFSAIIALGIGMACMDVTAPVAWAVAMDIGGLRSGTVSGAMNTTGLTGAYISTVSFGYLASAYGYYFPLLLIGIIVLIGSFVWFKIDATEILINESRALGTKINKKI
ncbi:MAG: MFS transporter [Chitinophagaceae bacterium]|nr:MFS transporter [Chitinophagaceae bacterium]